MSILKKLKNKEQLKLDISFIFLMLAVAAGMYFCQGVALLDSDPRRVMNIRELVILFCITMAPSVAYATLKIKYKEEFTRFDIVVGVLCIFLMILNTITVCMLPSGASTYAMDQSKLPGVTFTYSRSEKLYSILYGIVTYVTGYILLCELPKKCRCAKHVGFWFSISMVFCVAFMLHSYCTQTDEYISTIVNFDYAHIKILFIDTCNCAVWLFYMMFGCFYMNIRKPNILWYVLALFFLINIYFQKSKVNLFMGTILFVSYTYFRLIYTFKNHKKRNITFLSLFSVFLLGTCLCFYIFRNSPDNVYYKLWNQIMYEFEITVQSTEARITIWEDVLSIFNNSNALYTGVGYSIFNKILLVYREGVTDLPHNAFLEWVGVGGLPLLLAFYGLYAYTYVIIYRMRKRNPSLAFVCLMVNTLYIVHMMFDSNTPFFMTSTPIPDTLFLAFVCVIPSLSEYYHWKHKEDNMGLRFIPQVKETNYNFSKRYMFYVVLLISSVLPFLIVNRDAISPAIYISAYGVFGLLIIVAHIAQKTAEGKYNVLDYFVKVILPYILIGGLCSTVTTIVYIAIPFDSTLYPVLLIVFNLSMYLTILICIPGIHELVTPLSNTVVKLNRIITIQERKDIRD